MIGDSTLGTLDFGVSTLAGYLEASTFAGGFVGSTLAGGFRGSTLAGDFEGWGFWTAAFLGFEPPLS